MIDKGEFEKTLSNVNAWSVERGLDKADPAKQMCKAIEELGELAAAIVRNDITQQIDAVGDVLVVLTILAQQLGLDLAGCYFLAYNEIKNRKGEMVNGVFVKESDLSVGERITKHHFDRRGDPRVRLDD